MTKVALGIIEKDGKILVARRTKDDPLKGKWEFPGGKVISGETPEECAKREVFEELGIEITVTEFICSSNHEYDHESVSLLAFRAHPESVDIQKKEYVDIEWVLPSDLYRFDFPEGNMPILDKIAGYADQDSDITR